MAMNHLPDLSRRALLQRAGALGMLGAGLPLALNLAAAGEASAFDASDYKALVCVFLQGGNDHPNTLVPYDLANYDRYSAIRAGGAGRTRGGLAYGHAELDATALVPGSGQSLTDGLQYALSPSLPRLASLFRSGKAAIQLNVGPLLAPLTRAQYDSGNHAAYPVPPKLFSHNDQISIWQSLGSEGTTVGWGGRIADLALSSNATSQLTCISASGNTVFVSGTKVSQYQIGPRGAVSIDSAKGVWRGSAANAAAMKALITQSSSNILENEYARVTRRSIDLEGVVNGALSPVQLSTPFGQSNALADQLRIVARLIGARHTLGIKRQVFFVNMAGFDMHDGLMNGHPVALARLDDALSAFYAATVELGVESQVTAFTASDFGRTLSSNGDGSDHGWGSHHFIVGGAVKGGRYYGTAPHVSLTSDDQVGQGRLLPSTSVDQMAATLASWFGVSNSEMSGVLPNIGRFATGNMGYFA